MAKKKRKAPKTLPTGFVPPGTKRFVPTFVVVAETSAESLKAWRVKNVYMQERGRFESTRAGRYVQYVPPGKYDGRAAVTVEGEYELEKMKASAWQAIVDWCKGRKVNPEAYVRQCFATIPLAQTRAPEPGQLLGDAYWGRWQATKDKRREEIRVALKIQKDTARRHLTVRQQLYGQTAEFAQICVFSDGRALGLSPLFCYCLATSIGTKKLLRIAGRLKAEAVLQFETSRALYKKFWADVLPGGFARESKDLYPYLLAKLWAARKKAKKD